MAGLGADGSHPTETLGALASVLSIWVVTAALVYLAAARIISNDYEIEARAMLATSACAVGVNLVYVPRVHPWSLCPISLSPAPLWPCNPKDHNCAPRSLYVPVHQPCVPRHCQPCPPYAQGFQSMCLHPHTPHSLVP